MTKPKASPRKRPVRVVPNRPAPRTSAGAARNDILDAALKIFARDTFEGASIVDIAALANTGQPLVHYHFRSKEGLWKAAVDHALSDLKLFFESISITTADLQPVDTLRVMCRAFLKFSSERPEHGLILWNELRVPGDRFGWMMTNYIVPIHRHLDALIQRGAELGQLKPIPPAHLTGTIFVTLLHFFTVEPMIKAAYDIDVTDPDVIADHMNYMMDFIFNGILAPGT